jgi:hypothetical protein
MILYDLSNLAIVLLFSGTIGGLFLVAPLLRKRVLGDVSDQVADFVRATMVPVVGFGGALLAFSLVQEMTNLRNVERTVALEAQQLDQLDRVLINYGSDLTSVRATVRNYAHTVVREEWPLLAQQSFSAQATEVFHKMTRELLSIHPTDQREGILYADFVRIVDQLSQSRDQRIAESALSLPSIFWEVIAALTILLIGFAAFVNHRHVYSLAGLGAGLALLIALVFVFDRPFLGNMSIQPTAIDKVIQLMNARASVGGLS